MDGTVGIAGTLSGVIQAKQSLSGVLSPIKGLSGGLTVPLSPEIYEGATEFTPTSQAQQILVGGKLVSTDITINPIPNNYGLITWNGSTLTVS